MTLYLLGAMTVLTLRPPNWATVADRIHRLLSIGAKPKGIGAPLPSGAERHLEWAQARETWGAVTSEFHALVRPMTMPEDAT